MRIYLLVIGVVLGAMLGGGCVAKLEGPIVHSAGNIESDRTAYLSCVAGERVLTKTRGSKLLVSSDSRYLGVWSSKGASIVDIQSGSETRLSERVYDLAFSPDSSRIALAVGNGVRILDVETRALIREWGSADECYHVSYSPDGKMLAYSDEKTVRVVSAETGVIMFEQPSKGGLVAFSPDNKKLAVATQTNWSGWPGWIGGTVWMFDSTLGLYSDDIFHLYDLTNGATIVEHSAANTAIRGMSFSADGSFVALGVIDDAIPDGGTAEVFDPTTGEKVFSKEIPGVMRGLSFSPEGKTIAVYSPFRFSGVQLYELPGGAARQHLVSELNADVRQVAFSPDGRLLAMAVAAPPVKNQGATVVFDLHKGQVAYAQIYEADIRAVAFLPNGQGIVVACDDGVRLIPLAELVASQ